MMSAHWKRPNTAYYTCNGKVIFSGEENMTKVTGKHMSGKADTWVKSLIVNQQGLKLMPENLKALYKNLILIEIQSNQITEITRRDIESFPNLIYLNIAQNQIQKVDSDLFLSTPKLEYVNFSGNMILSVGFGLLDPVKEISKVFFLNNSCINLQFDSSLKSSLSYLKLQLAELCSDTVEKVVESTLLQLHNFVSAQESIRNHSKALVKLNDRNDETILRIIELEERLKIVGIRLNETVGLSINYLKRISQLENHYIESSLYLKYLMNRP